MAKKKAAKKVPKHLQPKPPETSKRKGGGRRIYTAEESRQRNAEKQRNWQMDNWRSGRDIAPIDFAGIDWERRNACSRNLELFGLTYLKPVFFMSLSDIHRTAIRKLQIVTFEGGRFALAMPRGSGKTAWCRAALLWQTAYGYKRFPFNIASNEEKSQETLDFIRAQWHQNRLLHKDFPEIGHPIMKLEGRYHLAKGQLYNDQPTYIEWTKEGCRYPCILLREEEAALYPEDFLIKLDATTGYQGLYLPKSCGTTIVTAGIDGSIRGEALTHPLTLEMLRPDTVLLDDIQKEQKAESPTTCEKMIRLIDGAIEGLAGPGQDISCFMPCTTIRENDVSDTFLSRQKRPEWLGERCSMVITWPDGISDYDITMETEEGKAWNTYSELRKKSLRTQENIQLATDFYSENRQLMDRNFVVSWRERYLKNEISPQQHAMNLRLNNPLTFASEYQNKPRPLDAKLSPLIPAAVLAERVSGFKRGELPPDTHTVVAHIDIQNEMLFWVVYGAAIDYSGSFIDYGTWPPVPTRYFPRFASEGWSLLTKEFFQAYPQHRDKATQTEGGKTRAPLEAKIYYAVQECYKYLSQKVYTRAEINAPPMFIKRYGFDSRWGKASDAIKKAVMDIRRPNVICTQGQFVSPAHKQYEEYEMTKGWLFEHQLVPGLSECKWIYRLNKDGQYYLAMDVSRVKTFLMNRLAAPQGSSGAITLFNAMVEDHEMFCDHVCASEYPEPTMARGRVKDMWTKRESGPDNDYLDCTVGCLCLAGMEGCRLNPDASKGINLPPPSRRKKLSEMWAEKRGQ